MDFSVPQTPSIRRGRRRLSLSAAEARRVALAAQGFADDGLRRPAPDGAVPTGRHLRGVLGRVGLLQIDSVNALCRSHYLPLFSRLGFYPFALLERAAFQPGPSRRRVLFEYWGHEASLLPVEMHPLFRWRMARAARGEGIYGSLRRIAREQPALVERVYQEVAVRKQPTRAGELAHLDPITPAERRRAAGNGGSSWWGWGDVKRAVEFLFWSGRLTAAGRAGNFERLYAVPERVLPPEVLAAPTPPEDAAQRELVRRAARHLGVATESDLRDYFRLDVADARARVAELVEGDELLPIQVEGWRAPAYLHPDARVPRPSAVAEARALLSPFDSLVWERARTERLFHGFRYRLEIYTPAHKRVHGYYVLPFLLGERLAARVDLRADRAAGILRVPGAHAEMGVAPEAIVGPLAEELRALATWLGLERGVRVEAGIAAAGLAGRLRREF